jgi:hypothetical protein
MMNKSRTFTHISFTHPGIKESTCFVLRRIERGGAVLEDLNKERRRRTH